MPNSPSSLSPASGTKGGTVLIGGDQAGGHDPARKLVAAAVATAQTTTVASGAVISADGTAGDGGAVIVWSELQTDYAGAISARGAGAGNGGAAETSSHGVLKFTGTVDLTSANAKTGTLLLDPLNLVISNGVTSGAGSAPDFVAGNAASVLNNSDLQTALSTANITVTASGSIGVTQTVTWTSGHSLTLDAGTTLTIGGSGSN